MELKNIAKRIELIEKSISPGPPLAICVFRNESDPRGFARDFNTGDLIDLATIDKRTRVLTIITHYERKKNSVT
jgi:hypothetical protein